MLRVLIPALFDVRQVTVLELRDLALGKPAGLDEEVHAEAQGAERQRGAERGQGRLVAIQEEERGGECGHGPYEEPAVGREWAWERLLEALALERDLVGGLHQAFPQTRVRPIPRLVAVDEVRHLPEQRCRRLVAEEVFGDLPLVRLDSRLQPLCSGTPNSTY